MYNKSLVSVLIPAYNHEKYVQETIKSIIDQTYQNIELLIVDDGSKDSTWQKIQQMKDECEKRFPRVHFETKENEGTCKTLNRLLSLAQGEYVYVIASDDMAKPEAISKEVKFLNENPEYALVVGDNEIIDSDSNVCYWDKDRNLVKSKQDATYITFCDFLQKIRNFCFTDEQFGTYQTLYVQGNHVPNGYLIRRKIFEKTGYFTTKAPLEDHWLMLQISKYAKMKYLDQILFSYRWHDTNTIKNNTKIGRYSEITKQYEIDNFENIDIASLTKSAMQYFKFGKLYKKIGIKNIFEILKYKKFNRKVKILKLFGLTVYKKEKTISV